MECDIIALIANGRFLFNSCRRNIPLPMKVLISAIACHPTAGSEGFVGWQAVSALRHDHKLWVLTSKSAETAIRDVQDRDPLWNNVSFFYLGEDKPCHPNRTIARIQSWLDCFRWNKKALELAGPLHKNVGFDVIHHVTYASWRVASPLWKVGPPLVWGPLGGASSFPAEMFGTLSLTAFFFEHLRNLSNRLGRFDPAVKKCLAAAAVVAATNEETRQFLCRLPVRRDIEKCWLTYFTDEQLTKFSSAGNNKQFSSKPLLLFAGGNLQGSKGVAIAFRALALAKARGLKFRYCLAGNGPEYAYLIALAKRLGIEEDLDAGRVFSGEAYAEQLGRAHIYLLPSFREALGLTLVEAMLAQCVPIVADVSATAEIVTGTSGFKVPMASPEVMAGRIAEVLLDVDQHRDLLTHMGEAARQRALELFTEEKYRQNTSALYDKALAAGRFGSSAVC